MNLTFAIGGDITVNRLGFGAMRLTGSNWPTADERRHGVAVARRAVELGVTFIDTADSYCLGANEQLLAEALHPYPEGLLIATKAGQSRPGGAWRPLGRPEYLKQQAELSLRRLRLERIDLFQLHRIDPQVPQDDQIGALRELQEDGLIRDIGLSEVSVDQLRAAREIAPIASVQNRYGLHDRGHDDVLDYCDTHGIAFIPWLPLGGGKPAAISRADEVASQLDVTSSQVALAWLLHRSEVIIPIPGTSSIPHLTENTAAARVELSSRQLELLSGE